MRYKHTGIYITRDELAGLREQWQAFCDLRGTEPLYKIDPYETAKALMEKYNAPKESTKISLTGEFVIEIKEDKKEMVFFKGDKVKINSEATITGYQEKQDGGIRYNTSSGGTFKESELTLIKGKDEDKPKPEEIQLYCVKDFYPGKWLTKGKIYKFINGQITYDNGYTGMKLSSWEEYKRINYGYAECLYPLVKRPAKKGESMLVTNSDNWHGNKYKNGDILTCHGSREGGRSVCYTDDTIIYNTEYLVLDGYTAEPEKSVYYNGKVVCVDHAGYARYWTVGKAYKVTNGVMCFDSGEAAVKDIKSIEDIMTRSSAKFAVLIEDEQKEKR